MPERLLHRLPAAFALAALAAVPAILYATSRPTLDRLTIEDGFIESIQALAFALGGLLFVWRAVRRRGRDLWSLLLGLGLLMIAGEEISWGQRLFGIETPAGLEARNVQGEFNLHNIEGLHQNVRALGLVVIVSLFVLVPLLQRRVGWVKRLLDRLAVPEVPLWAVPLALVALAYMVVPRLLGDIVFSLDESGELFVALTALAFAVHAWLQRVDRPVETVVPVAVGGTLAVTSS